MNVFAPVLTFTFVSIFKILKFKVSHGLEKIWLNSVGKQRDVERTITGYISIIYSSG